MCSSFKSLAAAIYHFAQRGRAIALLPGPKNQIMRPGEGVYTVDLHKFQGHATSDPVACQAVAFAADDGLRSVGGPVRLEECQSLSCT